MNNALGNISPQCSKVIKEAWMGDLGSCINIVGLFSMASADPKKSVLPQLNDYVMGLSQEDPCDPKLLNSLNANIEANCSPQDEKQSSVDMVVKIIKNYPGLYHMLTLRPNNATTGATYCLTRMLARGQEVSGQPFTAPYLSNTFNGNMGPLIKILSKDSRIYCNDCGHDTLNTALVIAKNNSASGTELADMKRTINSKCGNDFANDNVEVSEGLSVGTDGATHLILPGASLLLFFFLSVMITAEWL